MLQGHHDCGVDWFRPKLNYKVLTRGRKLAVNLSCDGDINRSASASQHVTSTWEDYVWFQAPAALKGFHEWPTLCRTSVEYRITFGAALSDNFIKYNCVFLSVWILYSGRLLPSCSSTVSICFHLLNGCWKQLPFKAQLHKDTVILWGPELWYRRLIGALGVKLSCCVLAELANTG